MLIETSEEMLLSENTNLKRHSKKIAMLKTLIANTLNSVFQFQFNLSDERYFFKVLKINKKFTL